MISYIEILLAFLSIFLLYWTLNRNSPVISWPVVRMLPSLFHNRDHLHDFFTQILEQGKGTFKFQTFWFSNLNFVLTNDSKNVHYILSKKFNKFQKGPEFRAIFEPLGDGIFNSNGDLWKSQRRELHSLLKLKTYELAVQRILKQKIQQGLIPILESFCEKGLVTDLQDVLHRFTFDTTCLLILGFDPGCLSPDFPDVLCEKAYDEMEELALRRHVFPMSIWKLEYWLQIGVAKRGKQAWESMDKFLLDHILIIRDKLSRKLHASPDEEEDFNILTTLLKENGEKSSKFLRDTAFNLLAAGRDTIAAALVWFLWLVATHPSVEENILKEIKVSFPENQDNEWKIYSREELGKLVYLHRTVLEVLRLYPPVPFEHRAAVEPEVLPSGHRVSRDEKIYISIYSMGRSKEIWGEDCLEFKPQRWLSEQGDSILHVPSHEFMPFLTGPRTCLGKDTSFYQIKNIGLAIIQSYHIKVVENLVVAPSRSIILKMKNGLHIRLNKRSHHCGRN